MRVLRKLKKSKYECGFSLTEVVLAIAITAVAVVGVMTAFPVGLTASRDSRDENVLSSIAEDVLSRIRAQQFTAVGLPNGDTVNLGQPVNGVPYNPSDSKIMYYSASGEPAKQGTFEGPSPNDIYREDEGYFGVKVTIVNNPYYNVPTLSSGTMSSSPITMLNNLSKVILDISWPARAPLTPVDRRQHSIFVSYIANMN